MDPTLFFIVLIPVAISLACKFVLKFQISWLEFASQVVIGLAALSLIWAIGAHSAAADREVINGAVTSKDVNRERCYTNMIASVCRNSYSCNCHQVCSTSTDSKGNRTESCHTECDTCYRYDWEQDWEVSSNISRSPYDISRVDDQGAREPTRWTQVRVGDPVSRTQSFQNWVKASAGTLFRDGDTGLETYKAILPEYPLEIYDYYRIDRVVTPNVRLSNERLWNAEISAKLAILGPSKHINAIFVFVEGQPNDYAYALRRKWNGFKQNDAVIVVGLQGGNVRWVEVMSWSSRSIFDVQLSQAMKAYVGRPIAQVPPAEVLTTFERITLASFERRQMEEFEYLKGDIKPPTWLLWTSIIFALIIGAGTSYFFHQFDLDDAIFNRRSSTRFNRY